MESKSGVASLTERAFAGKWIAGPYIEDAIGRARRLNALGISVIINYLGEQFTDRKDASEAVATYLQLVRAINKSHVDACISVKMTQLGLDIGKGFARSNYDRVVNFARKNAVRVFIDMEESNDIDGAISVYEKQVRRGGVGIALQANMRRSEDDMKRLVKEKADIRLVKGAYKANKKIAFQEKDEIEKNYLTLMRYLFKHARSFTIATHDSDLLEEAILLNRSYRRNLTLAMLNGIRNNYAASLAAQGNRVAIYVPFGTRWVEYSIRRLREVSHLMLILRSLLGG